MPTPDYFEDDQDFAEVRTGTIDLVPDNAIKDQPEPTAGEAWDASRRSEAMVYALARYNLDNDFPGDPEFRLNDHWESLTQGMNPNDADIFHSARSLRHAEHIRRQYDEEMADLETTARYGWKGFGMRMAAGVFDEGNAALVLAPEVAIPARIGKIARAVRVGTVAGAENAAIEAFLFKTQHTREAEDIAFAGLAGFALGAPIGYLTGKEADMMNKFAHGQAAELEGRAVKDFLREQGEVAPDPKDLQFKEAEEAVLDSTGAMRARGVETEIRDDAFTAEELNAPRGKFGAIRYDMVGKLLDSENPIARYAGHLIGEDAVGHYQKETASEFASRLNAQVNTRVHAVSERTFKEWVKENNLPWTARFSHRGDFFEQVAEAIRTGSHTDPHVKKVAEQYRRGFKTLLDEAKRTGVKGFEDVADNPNYMPRIFNYAKVMELNKRYGDQIPNLIEEAIKRHQPDIPPHVARRLAEGYWKGAVRRTYGSDLDFVKPFSIERKEHIRALLDEAGVDPDESLNIMNQLDSLSKKEGTISRAKRRTDLDESTSMIFKDAEGNAKEVKLSDLFDNNVERVFAHYSRQVSGHVAMADKMGIKSKGDWAKFMERVRWGGQQKGMLPKAIQGDVQRLQNMYDLITGRPLEKDPAGLYAQTARLLRGVNFSRVMNQVGFAQLAEIGNLLSIGGFRATLRHMPEFRKMLTRMKDGNLEDSLMREIEWVVPLGTDRLRNPVHTRHDDFGLEADMFGKVDTVIQHANRITADISGMAPITLTIQRMATKVVAQNFADLAVGGKGFSAQRLLALGINKSELDRISRMIKTHSVMEPSIFGKKAPKLRELNLEDWTDTQARDLFVGAMYRMGRKIIQENDFGNTAGLMHTTTGKILTQFRSFMLVAWQKQTLHNLAMRDWAAFSSFMTTTFFGGLAYGMQQYANSIGRPDRSEYLEKRLDPAVWARQAFMRSGHSSLIPATIDTVWSDMLQQDALFRYGRSTQLGSGLGKGIPTADLIDKSRTVPRLLSLPFDNVDFSQQHFRGLTGLLPFQNALGVRNVLEHLGRDLPKEARND